MKDGSQQLKDIYAQMLDGELQGLARELDSLSEIAKPLLLDELARRGLPVAPEPLRESAVPSGELELVPLTQARTVDDLGDLRDLLDEAQIPSFLGPSKVPGWIGISVHKQDEERANLAIEQAARQKLEGFDEAADHPTSCPECSSPDIAIWANEIPEDAEPDLEPQFHWVCDACRHEWVDDGLAAESL